nr:MAG TPA: hypothetical protein [Caudoviricetes sp.]
MTFHDESSWMDCGVRSVKELSGESALIGLPERALHGGAAFLE